MKTRQVCFLKPALNLGHTFSIMTSCCSSLPTLNWYRLEVERENIKNFWMIGLPSTLIFNGPRSWLK